MEQPVTLSREALDEFKKIYREEYGGDLSDAEAAEMGIRLLRLVDILSRPTGASPRKLSTPVI